VPAGKWPSITGNKLCKPKNCNLLNYPFKIINCCASIFVTDEVYAIITVAGNGEDIIPAKCSAYKQLINLIQTIAICAALNLPAEKRYLPSAKKLPKICIEAFCHFQNMLSLSFFIITLDPPSPPQLSSDPSIFNSVLRVYKGESEQ